MLPVKSSKNTVSLFPKLAMKCFWTSGIRYTLAHKTRALIFFFEYVEDTFCEFSICEMLLDFIFLIH